MQSLNKPFKLFSGREVKREVGGGVARAEMAKVPHSNVFDRFLRYTSLSPKQIHSCPRKEADGENASW